MAAHPFLRRSSDRDEIEGFKRRVPPRPSQAAKRRASIMSTTAYHEPTPGLSPTSSEASFGGLHPSPPDPYATHLLPDVEEHKPSVFGQPPAFAFNMGRFAIPALPHPQGNTQSGMHASPYPYSSSPEDPGLFGNLGIGSTSVTDPSAGAYFGLAGRPIAAPAAPAGSGGPTLASPFAFSAPSYFSRGPPGATPASAPANIHGFSPELRISQGHIRTRSVQGEPPSAMISGDFSPDSPLAPIAWAPGYSVSPIQCAHGGMDLDNEHECPNHHHGQGHDDHDAHGAQNAHGAHQRALTADADTPEPALRGTGGATPTYDPDDPTTWIRRGWTDLATGAIVPPPAGRDMLGRVILGGSPASLPSDFAPVGRGGESGGGSGRGSGGVGANGQQCAHEPVYVSPVGSAFGGEQSGPLDASPEVHEYGRAGREYGCGCGQQHGQGDGHESGRCCEHGHGHDEHRDDPSPKTVSPGVYQAGFSLPAFKIEPLAPALPHAALYAPNSLSHTQMHTLSRSPRTPSKTNINLFASRLERRGSLSTSPYSHALSHSHSHSHSQPSASYSASPRTNHRPQLSLGPLPTWRPAGPGLGNGPGPLGSSLGLGGAMGNAPSLGSMPGVSELARLGLEGGRSPHAEDGRVRRVGGGGVEGGGGGGGGASGWERNEDMDEALPSAGLRGLMRGPFDALLPAGGEDHAGMEMG